MEFIEYEYNFSAFCEFLDEHNGVLNHDDYCQYVLLAIKYKNIKILKYIIQNNLLSNWNQCISLLNDYDMKDCLELLIKMNVDINSKNENNTILYNSIINYITTQDNEDDKLYYIIYIIQNNGKLNIQNLCSEIKEHLLTDDNIQKIINSIDLLLLYNVFNEKLDLDTEELQLLFQNINKNNNEILQNCDLSFVNTLKKYFDVQTNDDLLLNINKLSIINKSSWIDDDLFVYHDGTQNWCLSSEDVKYIKNTKMNPLNDTKIPDYIINLM